MGAEGRRHKILVVDDEQPILTTTCLILGELGFEAIACGNAAGIREAVERERPDLVLQDVRMPGLDLEAVIGELRKDPAHVNLRIVLFTASMDAEEMKDRLRADGLLDKPFSIAALRQTVTSLLGNVPTTPSSAA